MVALKVILFLLEALAVSQHRQCISLFAKSRPAKARCAHYILKFWRKVLQTHNSPSCSFHVRVYKCLCLRCAGVMEALLEEGCIIIATSNRAPW